MTFITKDQNSPILKEEKTGEMVYLTFPTFSNTGLVSHLFSTKRGGVSKGIFESMNLSYTRGDERQAVDENFARIARVLGRKTSDFILSKQTHTTNVRIVGREDAGKGIVRPSDFEDVDGFITNVPGIVLVTVYADCVPLFFLDPINKVIGLSHSGWKGTLNNIARETVRLMQKEYGSNPKDILTAIGPSICQECYEVDLDVAKQFDESCIVKKQNGKYLLDLWKANTINLMEEGITREHIEVTDICTCCNYKELFSHRATNGQRGNLGAFLSLEPY